MTDYRPVTNTHYTARRRDFGVSKMTNLSVTPVVPISELVGALLQLSGMSTPSVSDGTEMDSQDFAALASPRDQTAITLLAEIAARLAAPPSAVAHGQQAFQPLETLNCTTVPTDAAAFYVNRKPQTMRSWACTEAGPLRPIRINGRLHWPVSQIKILLNGGL
jgi:hypothetical protein